MSGTISLSPSARWSAASWLFDWVLKTVASSVQDAELAAELTGIVAENIGWIALNDLTDEQRTEMQTAIRDVLRAAAQQGLPAEIAERDDALKHVDELVRLTSAL